VIKPWAKHKRLARIILRPLLQILFIMTVSLSCQNAAKAADPSFNCSRATKQDELAICSNDELSSLDVEASSAYIKMRERVGTSEGNRIARYYRTRRNACQDNIVCIKIAIMESINAYQKAGTSHESVNVSESKGDNESDTIDTRVNTPPVRLRAFLRSLEPPSMKSAITIAVIAAGLIALSAGQFWVSISKSAFEQLTTSDLERASYSLPVVYTTFIIVFLILLLALLNLHDVASFALSFLDSIDHYIDKRT
jgi:uncharacterized protein